MILRLTSVLFLSLLHSSSTYNCTEYSHCIQHEEGDIEIQCPSSDNMDFVVHLKEKQREVLVQCPSDLESLLLRQFPLFNMTNDVNTFRMQFCPWMPQSLSRLLSRLSLHQIDTLEVSGSTTETINLAAKSFVDLSGLKELNLSNNNIRNLTEDVFSNVPNLLRLDLRGNGLVLRPGLLKTVHRLEVLNLSDNNLTSLPLGVFQPVKKLKVLDLWKNKLTELHRQGFEGLIHLRTLELSFNRIEKVTSDAFEELRNLREISLSHNQLKKLPLKLFKNNQKLKLVNLGSNLQLSLDDYFFANTSIVEVRISNCNPYRLPGRLFDQAERLRIVKLQDNKLTELPKDLFQGLTNLTQVWLDDNRIKKLDGIFSGLTNLKILSLENNLIEELSAEVLFDLVNLERLVLKGNMLKYVSSAVFQKKWRLKTVNLSFNSIVTPLGEMIDLNDTPSLVVLNLKHNLIPTVRLDRLSSNRNITIKLDYNNITTIDFTNVTSSSSSVKISLRNNSIDCCQNYDLLEHFIEPRVPNLMIYPKNIICNTNLTKIVCPLENMSKNYTSCSDQCSCSWIPAAKSILIDCSNRNLTKFPTIDLSRVDFVVFNQSEGRFEGNRLRVGPNKSDVFENITRLFLSSNEIREIDWLPPKLEVLALDHNRISRLKNEVIETLNNSLLLVEVLLNDNPWVCDCNSAIFADFLRQRTSLVQNLSDVACINREETLFALNKSELCIIPGGKHLIPMILSFFLVVAVLMAFYYRYQQSLKIWLFSKHCCLFWITEEEIDKDKEFDAFISYSHKDERMVTELAKTLESQDYKLCLHYRNWIPGEFISEQITSSVSKSRRTIVVLSKDFLKSEWGKLEFRTAHIQAMTDGRIRVIIILYGDVEVNELDKEFQLYLKTNTYIKWRDVYFWERLRYALPHKVGRRAKQHKFNGGDRLV